MHRQGRQTPTFTGMEAGTGAFALARTKGLELWLPLGVTLVAAATIAYGISARADGVELGAGLAPFLADWRPSFRPTAIPAVVCSSAA